MQFCGRRRAIGIYYEFRFLLTVLLMKTPYKYKTLNKPFKKSLGQLILVRLELMLLKLTFST